MLLQMYHNSNNESYPPFKKLLMLQESYTAKKKKKIIHSDTCCTCVLEIFYFGGVGIRGIFKLWYQIYMYIEGRQKHGNWVLREILYSKIIEQCTCI